MERVRVLMEMVQEEFELHEQHEGKLAKYREELDTWREKNEGLERPDYRDYPEYPSKPSVEKLKRLMLVLRQETIALERRL